MPTGCILISWTVCFVPNISFGFPVLKYVAKLSQKPLDVHLMIVQPEKFLREVKELGTMMMNASIEITRLVCTCIG